MYFKRECQYYWLHRKQAQTTRATQADRKVVVSLNLRDSCVRKHRHTWKPELCCPSNQLLMTFAISKTALGTQAPVVALCSHPTHLTYGNGRSHAWSRHCLGK